MTRRYRFDPPAWLAIALLFLALAVGGMAGGHDPADFEPSRPPAAPPACFEDEPCWRCDVMGNRSCFPTATDR